MDDGLKEITIAHLEHSLGELKFLGMLIFHPLSIYKISRAYVSQVGGVGGKYIIGPFFQQKIRLAPFFLIMGGRAKYMTGPPFFSKNYEWPHFSGLWGGGPSIWLGPLFSAKIMSGPIFLDYWGGEGPKYMIGPYFSAKNIWLDPFFCISIWKVPLYMHIFFVQRFIEATCSQGIQWTDRYICLTTSNKWVQKVKGQYMNGSTFQMI